MQRLLLTVATLVLGAVIWHEAEGAPNSPLKNAV